MSVDLTMDQIPTPRQSNQSSSDNSAFNTNVVSGNVLVAAYYSAASITTPTIADTRGSTWTLRASPSGPGGILGGTFYVWTATLGSSGANTVTITESGATSQTLTIVELTQVTELIDVIATATATVSAGTMTMPNVTTTHYRDLILDMLLIGGQVGPPHDVAFTSNFLALDVNIGIPAQAFFSRLSGDPGTVTGAVYTTTAGGGSNSLQIVMALRSTSALTVSTPSIPDAVVSQSYSFQMQATGGAGTNVWTITSGVLPPGLSLSSAGVISGTPTASNGNTITFHVADSAAATATANLALHVGASANTIARVQGASGPILNGVTAGNIILFGIVNTSAFASVYAEHSFISDGLGSIYRPIPGASGDATLLYWGVAGSSGNINMSVSPSLTSGFVWISEWTNVQPIFDTGVVAKYVSTTGASPISSGAIISPVAEMLYAFASPGTLAAVVTAVAPFTRDINATGGASARQSESDYALGQTAGSHTASWTVTGNTSNQIAMTLLGLRPTTSGTAPATGNIIIQKVTAPSGSLQSFTFTPSYGSPFNLTDGQTNDSGPLVAGTYSVVETPVSGWATTTSSNPAAIVVTAGATTTVTFTNTQQGTIIVHKVTAPGGSLQSFGFTSSYGSPFNLLDGQSNNSGLIAPGTYSVTETPVAGWITTTDINPTAIVVTAGATVNITFTNTQQGHIIVEKVTNPPGSTQSFGFTPSYGSPFSLLDGQSNDSGGLAPGTYSVAEAPVVGWLTTTSQDPTAIVLAAGQSITITFTNTVQHIITTKATVPGGSSQAFLFTPNWGAPFTLLDGQSNDSGPLASGTYSIVETPAAGFATTTSQDPSAIVLAAGATVTITFTNTVVTPPPPELPCPEPAACPFTLDDAREALGARLYDPTHQFWSVPELTAYIVESLRTWNALASYWRDEFTFPSQQGVVWYDITDTTVAPNTLRPLTVTDQELMSVIEYHLLEPQTPTFPLTWTGSAQFSVADLQAALQRRRDEALSVTGCTITRLLLPAVPGKIPLPNRATELRRVAFIPAGSFGLAASPMFQDDWWALQAFRPTFTTDPAGVPDTYVISTEPIRDSALGPTITFLPNVPPGVPGQFEVLVLMSGTVLCPTGPTSVTIPDDWTWILKWGAIADLLSRESNAKDSLRAKYAEARYKQGLQLLSLAPALLTMRWNNLPLQIDAVKAADTYRPTWEGGVQDIPDAVVTAGMNLLGLAPPPTATGTTLTADVIRNAPVPCRGAMPAVGFGQGPFAGPPGFGGAVAVSGETCCLQVTRDAYDIVLDYAAHLAAFKQGGEEFIRSMPLMERFMYAAALSSSKLVECGEFTKILLRRSQLEDALNPRYSEPTPEAAND